MQNLEGMVELLESVMVETESVTQLAVDIHSDLIVSIFMQFQFHRLPWNLKVAVMTIIDDFVLLIRLGCAEGSRNH
jgi:hypothetical protein